MHRQMKDSGIYYIGLIPNDWIVSKVGRLGEYINGYAFKPEDWNDKGYPIIRIQNLSKTGVDCNRYNGSLPEKYKVFHGDYLISWSATLDIFIWIGEEAYLNQHIFKAIPNESIVYGNYFYWLAKWFMREMANDKHGTAMQHVTKGKFDGFQIPLPTDYNEQIKIANFLDRTVSQIDAIIDNTTETIKEYKKYKQSIITEAVTKGLDPNVEMKDSGIEWIGEVPKNWSIKKLKYLFSIKKDIAGYEGPDILSVTQSGIKVKDISSNEGQIAADYSKYQLVNGGDFIMNHMDLLTGWVDCSKYQGVTSPDYRVFYLLNPDMHSSEYFTYVFQTCYKNKVFYGMGQGVSNLGRWRLQTDKFINFYLPVPPKYEQEKIVEYINVKLKDIDSLILQKQIVLEELDLYKKSMIYECVTGKREVK